MRRTGRRDKSQVEAKVKSKIKVKVEAKVKIQENRDLLAAFFVFIVFIAKITSFGFAGFLMIIGLLRSVFKSLGLIFVWK